MDLNFSKEDLEFRDEVREFLDKEYPKHIKEKMNNGETSSLEKRLSNGIKLWLRKAGWVILGRLSMVVLVGMLLRYTYTLEN